MSCPVIFVSLHPDMDNEDTEMQNDLKYNRNDDREFRMKLTRTIYYIMEKTEIVA